MMKTFLSLSVLLILTIQVSFAQIVDRTEDHAKRKANNRVDQKIDKGIDKGLDAIEGLFGKKKKKNKDSDEEEAKSDSNENQEQNARAQNNMFSKMMGGDVDVQDSYSFDHNILLNVQSYDKKGKPEGENDMKMYFSESAPNFGMSMSMADKDKAADSFIIYDMKTYEMVTLMDQDGQKIGMGMKFDPADFEKLNDDGSKSSTHENIRFEKTGNSKTISGYSCDEYKVIDPDSDPDTESQLWITNDIDANWMGMMSNMMATNKKMNKELVLPESYPDGTVIQIVNNSTKNDEKTEMTVEEINKNQPKTVSTKGYQMMSLPTGKK